MENFSNSNAVASYNSDNFIGNNGVVWAYVESRNGNGDANGSGINLPALMLRRSSDNSRVTSSSITGGIGDFSVKLYKGFTGVGNRQVELFVNGISQGASIVFDDYNEHVFSVNDIDISGNVIIEIRNITEEQVIVDDILWTAYSNPDPNLVISGGPLNHGSVCTSTSATTIQYTITNTGSLSAAGITVISDDAQFVVSNLSSVTIPALGTATYDVTFTPTAGGVQIATITVASTTPMSNMPTSILSGTGDLPPVLSVQPTNQFEEMPNTGTFGVVASDATSYQWEINTGTSWTIVSSGTGGTSSTYTTENTSEMMNGYQYRCVVSNACGFEISNAATLSLTHDAPTNVDNISGCFLDDSVTVTWDAPTSNPSPDGYVIFIRQGNVDPNTITGDASDYNGFNQDFSIAPTASVDLGKYVYKGNATSAIITGLVEGFSYSITVYAYVGENLTGWAAGATNGSTITNALAQDDVRNLITTPDNAQITLNWLRPTPINCWDEIVIFANEGAVTVNPTGDGSAYIPNAVYATPNQVIFKGTGMVRTVTGLTNGNNYCFKAFVRRGTTWSDGIEICEIPAVTYCDATSTSDAFNTGVSGVVLNTINNIGTSTNNTYVDYTYLSTTLDIGGVYDLTVNLNADGNGTVNSRVWIDWNNDGDFNGANESYDLGTLYNPSNSVELIGPTSESPFSIEVPTAAVLGSMRMRVAAKWGGNPTSCEDNYSGEIEDYTIIIQQPAGAEINIKGNNITVPNGFNTPYGLNNTLFGATDLAGPYIEKPYFISNLGLSTLNFTNTPIVEIIGAHS